MKKILYLLMFLLVFSCGSKKASNGELNIYTWESFIPEEVISDFEKETNIKVNVSYYDSLDVMYSKLLVGATEYDIISPSSDFVPALIKAGFLAKIDKNKLEKRIYDNLLIGEKQLKTFDEKLEYALPYNIFATGITIRKDAFKNLDFVKKGSLDIFSDSKYKGKMTILDDAREVLGLALQYLGYESNSSDLNQLKEAKELVLKWKENIAKFENVTYAKGVMSGEFVAAHGYPDILYEAEGEELNDYIYYLPKGAMMYIDNMSILKDAPNMENAYLFLNYLYRPENFVKVLDVFKTPSIFSDIEEISKPGLEIEEILSKSILPLPLDYKTKEFT